MVARDRYNLQEHYIVRCFRRTGVNLCTGCSHSPTCTGCRTKTYERIHWHASWRHVLHRNPFVHGSHISGMHHLPTPAEPISNPASTCCYTKPLQTGERSHTAVHSNQLPASSALLFLQYPTRHHARLTHTTRRHLKRNRPCCHVALNYHIITSNTRPQQTSSPT